MEREPLNAPNSASFGIPSPITLKELMNRYDILVARLNDDQIKAVTEEDRASDGNLEASTRETSGYNELILVCHLLLAPLTLDTKISRAGVEIAANTITERSIRIPWSNEQRDTLLTTGRRARWLLQQQQREQREGKRRKTNGDSHVDATPAYNETDLTTFNSLTPTLRVVRLNATNKSNEIALEWNMLGVAVDESIVSKISAAVTTTATILTCRDNVEVNDDETDNENLLASLSQTEIAAEEELLWRMAHTPIPIESTFVYGDS